MQPRWGDVLGVWVFLVAALAGAANPFQSAANAQLNKQLGQPVWAGLTVYAVGLAGMLAVLLVARSPWPAGSQVSWWAWTGGLISIVATVAGLMLAQKLGSGVFTGLSVTASLVASTLLDHFGVMGLERHPASPLRIVGCGLMIAGVWLVARF